MAGFLNALQWPEHFYCMWKWVKHLFKRFAPNCYSFSGSKAVTHRLTDDFSLQGHIRSFPFYNACFPQKVQTTEILCWKFPLFHHNMNCEFNKECFTLFAVLPTCHCGGVVSLFQTERITRVSILGSGNTRIKAWFAC